MFSLLVFFATTVAAENYATRALPQNSPMLLLAGGSNPWAAPQTETLDERFTGLKKKHTQKNQKHSQKKWRFVTPDILNALKRQQTQMQRVPENRVLKNMLPGRLKFESSRSNAMRFGGNQNQRQFMMGMPYGMNLTNPMHDAPVVPPWGSGTDMLYRGESSPGSFPWVPNEAVGGLLPMPTPLSIENNQQSGYVSKAEKGHNNSTENGAENNVFNPFTFIPNKYLQ